MKKIVAMSIIMLFGGIAVAQDDPGIIIPQSVEEAFVCLYPGVNNVSWDFDEVNYSASFKLDGKTVSLLFDEYGSVVEVKNEIRLFELPPDVNDLLTDEYSDWAIGKASHIDSNGTGYYETVVEKEEQIMVLVFTENGGLLLKMLL